MFEIMIEYVLRVSKTLALMQSLACRAISRFRYKTQS
jgi:hypothetical protein